VPTTGAVGQIRQRGVAVGDKRIARVFAGADGRQLETVGQVHRHVFHGMHRQIGAAFLQGDFQFFNEQPFTADFR
jgi:hypothetical protein